MMNNTKRLRNLAALAFLTTALLTHSSRALADGDCPEYLGSGCSACYMLSNDSYVYYGCPEGCGFAQQLCEEWCGGSDDCVYDSGNGSCGDCSCPRVS